MISTDGDGPDMNTEAERRSWLASELRARADEVEQCGGRLIRSKVSVVEDGKEFEVVYRVYRDGDQ